MKNYNQHCLLVFSSRTSTLAAAEYLKENGVPYAVISTPKNLGIPCGISIKIAPQNLSFSSNLLKCNKLSFRVVN